MSIADGTSRLGLLSWGADPLTENNAFFVLGITFRPSLIPLVCVKYEIIYPHILNLPSKKHAKTKRSKITILIRLKTWQTKWIATFTSRLQYRTHRNQNMRAVPSTFNLLILVAYQNKRQNHPYTESTKDFWKTKLWLRRQIHFWLYIEKQNMHNMIIHIQIGHGQWPLK